MAIAVGSTSNTLTFGTRTNSTITAPSGIANGDLLVAILHVGDLTLLPPLAVAPPAGWAEAPNSPATVARTADNYTVALHIYWKVASSESGNYTFTHTSADTEGYMYRLTGADTTTPIDATPVVQTANGTTDGKTTGYGSLSTVTNGAFLIYGESLWDGPGSGTVSGSSPTISVRRSGAISWIGDGTQTTAGATSARTRTNGNSDNVLPWASIVVPIRPSGGSSISASASSTLGDLAGSGSAGVIASATLATTLGALTSSTGAAVRIQAQAAPTLAALTASATTTVPDGASSSSTLAPLTAAATTAVRISAAVSQPLAALTSVSAAANSVAAVTAATLAPLTSTAAGAATVSASISASLASLTVAAAVSTGSDSNVSVGAVLGAMTASAQASVIASASASATLAPLTAVSTTSDQIAATVNKTLGSLTVAATIGSGTVASVNRTLANMTASAQATTIVGAVASPRGASSSAHWMSSARTLSRRRSRNSLTATSKLSALRALTWTSAAL